MNFFQKGSLFFLGALLLFFPSLFAAPSNLKDWEIPVPHLAANLPFNTNRSITQETYAIAVKSTPVVRYLEKSHPNCPIDLEQIKKLDHSQIGMDFTVSGAVLSKDPYSIFDFCNLKGEEFNWSLLPFGRPSLKFLRFIGANLTEAGLKDVEIQGSDFLGAYLAKSHFDHSLISFSRFRSTNLNKTSFYHAQFSHCRFTNCSIEGTNFDGCKFKNCGFKQELLDKIKKSYGVYESSFEECYTID